MCGVFWRFNDLKIIIMASVYVEGFCAPIKKMFHCQLCDRPLFNYLLK